MYDVNIHIQCKLVKPIPEKILSHYRGKSTRTREPLTRDRIIQAATKLADEQGIEALSMRKLGAALDVEAMALYNHVANKDEIFDGMVDSVFASIPLPSPGEPWADSIRRVGTGAVEAFADHPWTMATLKSSGSAGPAFLRFADSVIGLLLDAGFSDEEAHHAWHMLASYTMGHALRQATASQLGHPYMDVEEIRPVDLAETYPDLARLAPLFERYDLATELAFGLEVIIQGLESRLT